MPVQIKSRYSKLGVWLAIAKILKNNLHIGFYRFLGLQAVQKITKILFQTFYFRFDFDFNLFKNKQNQAIYVAVFISSL